MQLKIVNFLTDKVINTLLGEPIYIRSVDNDYILSESDIGFPVMSNSNTLIPLVAILSSHDDDITIKLNGTKSCINEHILQRCEIETVFSLSKAERGYKILKNGKCLTVNEELKLELKKCKDNSSQEFTFDNQKKNYCLSYELIPEPSNSELKKYIKKKEKEKIKRQLDLHKLEDKKMRKSIQKLWKLKEWKGFGLKWPKLCLIKE